MDPRARRRDDAGAEDYLLAAITMGITLALSGAGILYYRHICKEQSEAK